MPWDFPDRQNPFVKQAHSHTSPEVIALPIIGGNEDYLKRVWAKRAEHLVHKTQSPLSGGRLADTQE